MARSSPTYAWMGALLVVAGCQCTPGDLSGERFACQTSADCLEGHVCVAQVCSSPSVADAGGADASTDAGGGAVGGAGGGGVGGSAGGGGGSTSDGGMDAGVDGGVLDCLVGNGGCDSNALCSGPAGSVTCACNSGWSGNGQSCVDVDECLTANGGCDANASCANTPGSRTCTCRPGFSGSGLTCTSTSDTCTNAITLVFDGGLNATATGSTFGLADDATSAVPSCGVFTSPDAVYRFTTSAAAQLTVNLTTTTPGYEPELSLRTICNSNANEVCTRAPGPGKPVNLFVSSLPAGNYALWVDGASGSSGTYAVNLQLAPVSLSPPSNALCSAAKVLASGPVQVGGTTIGAPSSYGNDTFSMTCRNNGAITGTPGAPGPDVVFDWTADATRTYSIVIEPFPGFDVVGWVTQAPVCAGDGGSCIAGADNNGPGGETFTLSADAGTRYFIIVDGYNPGDQGDFSLSIR